MVKLVVEQVNLDAYDYMDFFDAFVSIFRKWLNDKIGDEAKKYPFSYLTKKYGREFLMDVFGDEFEELVSRYSDDIDRYSIERIVTKLIKKGKFSFPTLRKDEYFTERFKRHLNYFIERLNLPPFARLELQEKTPYSVIGILHIDFPAALKSPETMPNADTIERSLKTSFMDFLGVELGEPEFGYLFFHVKRVYDGEKEWVNQVLNKQIKKDIKKLTFGDNVHSIKVEITGRVTLTLIYKSDAPWGPKYEFRQRVQEYLTGQGYTKISVENK